MAAPAQSSPGYRGRWPKLICSWDDLAFVTARFTHALNQDRIVQCVRLATDEEERLLRAACLDFEGTPGVAWEGRLWVVNVRMAWIDPEGYPITEAEDMPAIAANAFPLAFGDFKEGYLITDRVGMRITRDEITTPGFVKFYVRKRVGGKLRNTQAIKLLKIAAS